MTGPYQPPGGDINSPFGAPDPTSPFPPAAGSGSSDAPDPAAKDEEESSSAGVQYELETPGQPPMTPPPSSGPGYPHPPTSGGGGYGPPPPPAYPMAPAPTYAPPPKKSGNGLLIGGIIAGLVLLVLVVGVVMIVVTIGGDEGGDDSADNAKYKVISSPCSDVDLSPVRGLSEFTSEPTPSSNEYGTYGSASCVSATLGDYGSSSYGYFNMYIYTYSDVRGAKSMYETDMGTSGIGGCSTKNEISGGWDQGTLATGSGSSCAYGFVTDGTVTALVIQDANLEAKLTLDATSDIAGGAEDALKSVADSLLTAAKA